MTEIDSLKNELRLYREKTKKPKSIPPDFWPRIFHLIERIPPKELASSVGISYQNLQKRWKKELIRRGGLYFAELSSSSLTEESSSSLTEESSPGPPLALEIVVSKNITIKVFS